MGTDPRPQAESRKKGPVASGPSLNRKDTGEDVHPHLDLIAARSLRPVLIVLGMLYALFAAFDPWLLGSSGPASAWMTGATAILFLGAGLATLRWPLPPAWAHPAAAGASAIIIANGVQLIEFSGDSVHTIHLALLSIGAGLFFLSTPWLLGVFALEFLSWTIVALQHPEIPGWPRYGFVLLAATTLGGLAHGLRMGSTTRLLGGRLAEARARRRFQALSDAAFEGVLLMEGATVIDANRAAARLFGRKVDMLVGSDAGALLAEVPSRAGEATEVQHVRDGQERHLAVRRALLEEGYAREVLLVRDVTIEHLAEEARREAHEREKEMTRLQEREVIRTRFLARLGEELTEHLQPILDHAESMRVGAHGTLNERQQKALEVMDSDLRHLEWLVQELLDTAHVDSEDLPLEQDAVDVEDLVEGCIEGAQAAFEAKGVHLRVVDLDAGWVQGDAERLSQVVGTMLSTAFQATPRDGTVTVEALVNDGEAVIRVRDDGEGFDPARAEALFDPFPREETREGSGLGLFLARGIAQRHGGSLTATSAGSDQGATFELRLPVESARAAEAA